MQATTSVSATTTQATVTLPETMQAEWVGSASPHWANRYSTYFRNRKLSAESEGWTSWALRHTGRNVLYLVQTGTAFVAGVYGTATLLIARNEVPYHTAGKVVQAVHGVYTAKTRMPIDHDRVEAVVIKLCHIQKCRNAEAFIQRIQAVYNKGYLSSKASSNLITLLSSAEFDTVAKIRGIINFLTRSSSLAGYEDTYYNNGKWLYQIVVCMTEKSIIE